MARIMCSPYIPKTTDAARPAGKMSEHPSVWRKQFVAQAMFRVLDLHAVFPCLI
jgi:hypothetical protein